MQPAPPPPPGAYSQPVPPPKKGLSPLAWIGIGCGVIIVLGVIALGVVGWLAKRQIDKYGKNPTLAAAELVVRATPDLEVVSSDVDAGTLTVKNTKTGETATMNAKDIQDGKIEFKTDKGTAVFDASGKDGTLKVTDEKGQVTTFQAGQSAQSLPSWLPTYPGATVQGTFDSNTTEGRSASFSLTTSDGGEKVLAFYESELKKGGFKVDSTTLTTTPEGKGGILTASGENPHREISVLVGAQNGQTSATITFQEKKN